jgi:hypothetical protein
MGRFGVILQGTIYKICDYYLNPFLPQRAQRENTQRAAENAKDKDFSAVLCFFSAALSG